MNIITARLHVRDLIAEDCVALHTLRTDPLVYRFNHFGPESEAETRAWLKATIQHNQMVPRTSHNCAMVLRSSGVVIGWIGFGTASAAKRHDGELDFGYALRPPFWGQGYTTEALQAMFHFIFGELPVQRVFGECNVANPASARVMEKAGMRRVARYLDPDEPDPLRADSYRYAITRTEWAAHTAQKRI